MKTKTTRRALLLSALSLLMCVSMLVGTTFAWFTDSVQSGINTIQAGNLDVQLFHEDRGGSGEVGNTTKLFDDVTLWEPGAMVYEKLTVKNNGSLALKYTLKLNAEDVVTVDGKSLQDVLRVAILDAAPTRESIKGATTVALKDFALNYNDRALTAGNSDSFYLAIYWEPTANDNDYNLSTAMKVNIGVDLVATQYTYETDSYDDQYDKDSVYPGEAKTAEQLIAALQAGQSVKLAADIDLAGVAWTPIASYSGVFDGNGHTISNLTVSGSDDVGMFASLAGATVKNLTLENVNISATGLRSGALAGTTVKNTVNNVIENVTVNSGTITSSNYYAGGLLGADQAIDTVIRNCVNNVDVTSTNQYAGGIVAYATRGITIEDCVNNGDIIGASFVGGILGFASGKDDMADKYVMVKRCENTGSVTETATGPSFTWQGGVGGIIGNVGRSSGDGATKMLNFYILDCTVANGQKIYGQKHNVASGNDALLNVMVGTELGNTTGAEIMDLVKDLDDGAETLFYLSGDTYSGDINLTVAALGVDKSGKIVFMAAPGTNPVFTGTITLGYRHQNVGATAFSYDLVFDGITFNHAEPAHHSLDIQDINSITLTNCTVIGDGEYGITSAGGNNCGPSKITDCTFIDAGMQVLGNFGDGLVIDQCTFENSCVNVQGGRSVTIQYCEFYNTLTDAHLGGSFYAVRSNAIPITVKNCEINIDSELTAVATAQAKWALLWNRGNTAWTITDVVITLTTAAEQQTELLITKTVGGAMNTDNVKVNGVIYNP